MGQSVIRYSGSGKQCHHVITTVWCKPSVHHRGVLSLPIKEKDKNVRLVVYPSLYSVKLVPQKYHRWNMLDHLSSSLRFPVSSLSVRYSCFDCVSSGGAPVASTPSIGDPRQRLVRPKAYVIAFPFGQLVDTNSNSLNQLHRYLDPTCGRPSCGPLGIPLPLPLLLCLSFSYTGHLNQAAECLCHLQHVRIPNWTDLWHEVTLQFQILACIKGSDG